MQSLLSDKMIMPIVKTVIFPFLQSYAGNFVIVRPQNYGGIVGYKFNEFDKVESDYKSGKIDFVDLRIGVEHFIITYRDTIPIVCEMLKHKYIANN